MQLHSLGPKHKRKKKKRVGRGGKKGTYSGRGVKGQRARAGQKIKPVIRELIKKYPKLRGYRRKLKNKKKSLLKVVNLEMLEKKFKSGEIVNPKLLLERRIISKIKGKIPIVKILGKGKLTKSLIIENCQLSRKAKEKIQKAGGKIKTFPL